MSTAHSARRLAALTALLAGCLGGTESSANVDPDEGASGPRVERPAAEPSKGATAEKEDDDEPGAANGSPSAGGQPTVDATGMIRPQPGGQSGTDGSGSIACPTSGTSEIGLDEPTPVGTARAVIDAFMQGVEALDATTPFRWSPRFGGTTTIAIGEFEWGDTAMFTDSPQEGCQSLRVPVAIHVSTEDGVLDETARGLVNGPQFVGSFERSGELGRWVIDTAEQPGLELDSLGLSFMVAASQPFQGEVNATTAGDFDDEQLAHDLYSLGKFDSSWIRGVALDVPYARVAELDGACEAAPAADVSASSSPGISDLSGKLSRVWLRCSGTTTGFSTHDGIVLGGGRWQHVVFRDGAWVEELGFGHEGAMEILDTPINGPGSQAVSFWDMLPFTFANAGVDLSSDATSMHLAVGGLGSYAFDGTYVIGDVQVAAAQPEYADGTRAGAAACDKGEAHLHRFASTAELSTALAGSWVLCSGRFRDDATGIEFTSAGTYRHLAADGSTVAFGVYEIIDTGGFNGPGSNQINLLDGDGRTHIMTVVLQSDAPVKLAFGLAEGRAVLSAQ